MSKALANSTDKLAISPMELNEFPFGEVLVKLAQLKSSSSAIKSKVNYNKQSLRDSLKNEVVGTYPQLFPKSFIPAEIWDKICEEVDNFIVKGCNIVHAGNIISATSKFSHDKRLARIVLRQTVIGEDNLGLSEQRLGCGFLINDAEKRLNKIKMTLPYDADKVTKAESLLSSLQATKLGIEKEIVAQQIS